MIHVEPPLTRAPAPADEPTAHARAVIEDQLATLARLTQIGMDIAEACGREASQAPVEVGLTFARVARAVRMTIALQSRLLKDLAALDRADTVAQAARESRRRIRLRQLVGQAAWEGTQARIDAGARYSGEDAIEDEVEQLSAEAYERLTDAEDGGFSSLSFDQVVAAVVKDLGVSPAWADRIRAAAGPPGPPSDDSPMNAARSAGPAPPPDSGPAAIAQAPPTDRAPSPLSLPP